MTNNASKLRLHARVFSRRKAPNHDFLLTHRDFQFAAQCERMRVDRNGSVLSLLLIRLSNAKGGTADINSLSRVLEARLRVTDSPGLLEDGRIAVLLPDTPAEGAWKVATDISEVYPPGPDRPQCDVLVYPPPQWRKREGRPFEQTPDEVAEAKENGAEENSSEFFFAKSLPVWKRCIDIVGASIGLVVSTPVLFLAALAIKTTSPGPVFFCQIREGRGGTSFRIWKLRTMCVDAEEYKAHLLEHSQQDGPAFKMRRDPRTTPLGRFLRWSSIDELPQFWNVLMGDMSLVGPRPLPTAESQACQSWQRRRLDVNPGMTCTWQVCGRGKVRFDDWVRMDLQYVSRQSPWHDFKLVCMTLPALVFQRGMR